MSLTFTGGFVCLSLTSVEDVLVTMTPFNDKLSPPPAPSDDTNSLCHSIHNATVATGRLHPGLLCNYHQHSVFIVEQNLLVTDAVVWLLHTYMHACVHMFNLSLIHI